jgi:hypothetical protein
MMPEVAAIPGVSEDLISIDIECGFDSEENVAEIMMFP